jgi:hypothetical protein
MEIPLKNSDIDILTERIWNISKISIQELLVELEKVDEIKEYSVTVILEMDVSYDEIVIAAINY